MVAANSDARHQGIIPDPGDSIWKGRSAANVSLAWSAPGSLLVRQVPRTSATPSIHRPMQAGSFFRYSSRWHTGEQRTIRKRRPPSNSWMPTKTIGMALFQRFRRASIQRSPQPDHASTGTGSFELQSHDIAMLPRAIRDEVRSFRPAHYEFAWQLALWPRDIICREASGFHA